jgi:predicted AAA+ superfamily ATPase
VDRALGYQAAVAVIGPRQAGKTTLALDIARERGALYLDLARDRYPKAEGVEVVGLQVLARDLTAMAAA